MNRSYALLLPLVLMAPLFAQKIEVKPAGDDQSLRVSIQTKIQAKETRKMLRNGEEMTGGRGGGGGGGAGSGEATAQQEIVYEQSPAAANWRSYTKLAATETRTGPDGSPVENKIEGALQGKKVTFKTEGGKTSLVEGEGEAAKPVDENVARDIPGRLAVAGLLPAAAVAVGEEFDLSKTFAPALASLVHPVAAARGQAGGGRGQGGNGADAGGGNAGGNNAGGGGRRGNRGQGGADAGGGNAGGGGGRGQGGQGGAQGGRGGMRMGGGGVASVATQLIAAQKLDVKASGKIASVDEKDGQKIATIDITAKLTGKGKAADLGLRPQAAFGAMGGGRGGRGQGGQGGQGGGDTAAGANANAGTDNVDADMTITGKVMVNLTTNQVTAVEMNAGIKVDRKTVRTMETPDGNSMEMDTTANTEGKLEVKAAIESIAAKTEKK